MSEWERICALEAKVGTLEAICRTLSAKVRTLEAPSRQAVLQKSPKIQYDRYGREIPESPLPRGFNVPI